MANFTIDSKKTTAAQWSLVFCILLISSWFTLTNAQKNSYVIDEPLHIAAGLEILSTGSYTLEPQHPPVARMAAAVLPRLNGYHYVAGNLLIDTASKTLYQGDVDQLVALARLGLLPFFWLLLLIVFAWARDLTDSGSAFIALILVATCPPILAHAGLATLDIAAAATLITTLYLFYKLLENPSYNLWILFFVSNGLAICTKLSAIPFLTLIYLVSLSLLCFFQREKLRNSLSHLSISRILVCLFAFLITLWGAYGFNLIALGNSTQDFERKLTLASDSSAIVAHHLELIRYLASVKLPAFLVSLPAGIVQLLHHNSLGHVSYLWGETKSTGWWYFYLVSFFYKLPLLLLGLSITTIILWFWNKEKKWDLDANDVPLISVIVLVAYASFFSKINLGIRHLLVIIPLLAISISLLSRRILLNQKSIYGVATIGLISVIGLVSLVKENGEYLSYFNALAGKHPENIILESDFEWGQDFNRLAVEVSQLATESIALGVEKVGATKFEKLIHKNIIEMDVNTPVMGWFAVSQSWQRYKGLDMTVCLPQFAAIGKTINLYYTEKPITPYSCKRANRS